MELMDLIEGIDGIDCTIRWDRHHFPKATSYPLSNGIPGFAPCRWWRHSLSDFSLSRWPYLSAFLPWQGYLALTLHERPAAKPSTETPCASLLELHSSAPSMLTAMIRAENKVVAAVGLQNKRSCSDIGDSQPRIFRPSSCIMHFCIMHAELRSIQAFHAPFPAGCRTPMQQYRWQVPRSSYVRNLMQVVSVFKEVIRSSRIP